MTGFKSKKAMANDKIAELINEATAMAWIDRVVKGPIPIYTEEHMVKLAELIVEECAAIINDIPSSPQGSWSDGYYEGCRDSAKQIKRNFGIEE